MLRRTQDRPTQERQRRVQASIAMEWPPPQCEAKKKPAAAFWNLCSILVSEAIRGSTPPFLGLASSFLALYRFRRSRHGRDGRDGRTRYIKREPLLLQRSARVPLDPQIYPPLFGTGQPLSGPSPVSKKPPRVTGCHMRFLLATRGTRGTAPGTADERT